MQSFFSKNLRIGASTSIAGGDSMIGFESNELKKVVLDSIWLKYVLHWSQEALLEEDELY